MRDTAHACHTQILENNFLQRGEIFTNTSVTCPLATFRKKVDICHSEPIVYNLYFPRVTQSVPTRGKQRPQ
mgnify:CR=1 FL=1